MPELWAIVIGSVLQALSAVLVLRCAGRRWPSSPGAILILMLCLFHGLSEWLQIAFPGANSRRLLVGESGATFWLLLVSVAMLLYAIGYSTYRHAKKRSRPSPERLTPQVSVIVPAISVALLLPVALLGDDRVSRGYWLSGLADQFAVLSVVMLTISLIIRFKGRGMLLLFLFQASVLALLGSRLAVFAGTVMVMAVLVRDGVPIKKRTIAALLAILVIAGITISASRQLFGRNIYSGVVSERLLTFRESASYGLTQVSEVVSKDVVYRVDANTYGALIYESLGQGTSCTGLEPFLDNFGLVIPRFIFEDKLNLPEERRDNELYINLHYNLPMLDHTPTLFVIIFAFVGPIGLLVFAPLLGRFFAWFDSIAKLSSNLTVYLAHLGLLYCAVITEQGVTVYWLTLRGLVLMYFALRAGSSLEAMFTAANKTRKCYVN